MFVHFSLYGRSFKKRRGVKLIIFLPAAIKDISINWEMRDLGSGAVSELISDDLAVGSILHVR